MFGKYDHWIRSINNTASLSEGIPKQSVFIDCMADAFSPGTILEISNCSDKGLYKINSINGNSFLVSKYRDLNQTSKDSETKRIPEIVKKIPEIVKEIG